MTELAIENFRLIDYDVFDGAMNMAIDEAILNHYSLAKVPPTLRFYGWNPDALSIGYGQKLAEKVKERCEDLGLDIIRRPTGGRAVLHQNEFTYSFVCGTSSSSLEGAMLGKTILQAYKQICQGLILGFETLGLAVSLGASSKGYRDFDDCFKATTNADLHIKGKKIVGSAQLRRGDSVLQHGSIILNQDYELIPRIFGTSIDEETKKRHANLYEELGKSLSESTLVDAFKHGFEKALGCKFDTIELSETELSEAKELKHKYVVSQAVSS